MPGIGDFFAKGSIGEQLLVYGLLQQLIGAMIAPGVTELQQDAYNAAPNVALSAQESAGLVARGLVDKATVQEDANKGGTDATRFAQLIAGSHSAPALGELVAMLQRGIIARGDPIGTETTFDGGLTNAGLPPAWTALVAELAVQIPSVAEVMNAWLEGQIERPEALERYLKAGGDPTWFQTSYDANGQAPTPVQALELLNRGIIQESGTGPDSTSYEQAFLEGPWRNKWLPAFLALRNYIPPPRTVTAMVREGTLTESEGLKYLEWSGLDETLAAAYIKGASSHATAAAKELSQASVIALYEDKLLPRAETLAHLVGLKYSAADANLLLELADAKAAAGATKQAVTRIEALFKANKIDATSATASLATLGIDPGQITELLAIWQLGHAAAAKMLSTSQISRAWFYDLMSQAEAIAGIMGQGYDAVDAWLILSIENKGALPDKPPGAPVGISSA